MLRLSASTSRADNDLLVVVSVREDGRYLAVVSSVLGLALWHPVSMVGCFTMSHGKGAGWLFFLKGQKPCRQTVVNAEVFLRGDASPLTGQHRLRRLARIGA